MSGQLCVILLPVVVLPDGKCQKRVGGEGGERTKVCVRGGGGGTN